MTTFFTTLIFSSSKRAVSISCILVLWMLVGIGIGHSWATTQPDPCPSNSYIQFRSAPMLCPGSTQSVYLAAGEESGYTFQWSRNGAPIAGATTSSFFPTQEGEYSVAVTANGCTLYFGPLTVTRLSVTISATGTNVCPGRSTTFTATANDSGNSYQWLVNGSAAPGSTNSATYTTSSLTAGQTVSCVFTSSGMCSSRSVSSNSITVSPDPTDGSIRASATSICLGQPVTISSSGGNGVPSYWASTDGGTTWNVFAQAYSGQTSFSYTPTQAGTYRFLLHNRTVCGLCFETASASCPIYAYVDVVVNASPAKPVITTTGNATTFCGSGVLTAPAGYSSYVWSNGVTTQSITVTTSGSYSVTGKNSSNCSATSTPLAITINPNPSSTISGATNFCQGGSVKLNAPTGTGYSYVWRKDNVDIVPTSTASSYTATQAGSYSCVIKVNGACAVTSNSIAVTVNALPAAPEAYGNVTMTTLPNASITASSCYGGCVGGGCESWRGRLFDLSGSANWSAQTNDANQYLQIDLGTLKPVDAILTQGRHNSDQWVSSYRLSYSLNGSTWTDYPDLLTGNTNRSTVVKNTLTAPFSARYVRIKPVTYAGHMSMRAEIISISTDKTVTFVASQPANANSNRWYTASTGGTPLYTSTSFTTTLAAYSVTYYVSSYNTTTGCESPTRTAVTATYTSVAAEQDLNYIITNTVQIPGISIGVDIDKLSVSQRSQQTTYFDGLGRPMQSVTTQGSPTRQDIVQPIVYNIYGSEEAKYLPYTGGTNGFYKPAFVSEVTNFYKTVGNALASADGRATTDKPFAQTFFEASPLNRVLEQGAPGEAWQIGLDDQGNPLPSNKTVRMLERTNKQTSVSTAAATDDNVRQFKYSFGANDVFGSVSTTGYYAAKSIYVTETTDEQGNKTFAYKNKEGQVLLKKVQISSATTLTDANFAKTYYIYDAMGQLRMVIQPEGAELIPASGSFTPTAAFIDQWCFTYHYDAKGRMIEKKVPGTGMIVMVYNKRDQLILTQDAKQVANYQWGFTKYDALGRAVLTGLHSTGTIVVSRATMQNNADAVSAQWEIHNVVGGTNYGYTNVAFPTTSTQILSVSFYDDYNFDNSADLSNDYNHISANIPGEGVPFTRTIGKATGAKVRVLGTTTATPLTNDFLASVNFYDKYGQTIQTQSDNYVGGLLNGKEVSTSVYDFAGKLLQSKLQHTVNSTLTGITPTTVHKRFVYDHTGRLLNIFQKNNAETVEEKIAQNSYNELGQLKQKKVGLPISTTAVLQTMDYRYNIRGWLSKVNDASLSNTGVDNDLFGFELLYNSDY